MSAHSSSAGTSIQHHHQIPHILPTNTKGTSQSTCILFKFEDINTLIWWSVYLKIQIPCWPKLFTESSLNRHPTSSCNHPHAKIPTSLIVEQNSTNFITECTTSIIVSYHNSRALTWSMHTYPLSGANLHGDPSAAWNQSSPRMKTPQNFKG